MFEAMEIHLWSGKIYACGQDSTYLQSNAQIPTALRENLYQAHRSLGIEVPLLALKLGSLLRLKASSFEDRGFD